MLSTGELAWRAGYETGIACVEGRILYPEQSPYTEGSSEDVLWHLGFNDAWEDEFPLDA